MSSLLVSVYQKGLEGARRHSPETSFSPGLLPKTTLQAATVSGCRLGLCYHPLHTGLLFLGIHVGQEQDVTSALLGLAENPRCIPW